MAHVLVIGGSRGIGLEAVRQALEAGHRVRVLARTARRIPVRHPNLETMAGDALDPVTLRRALDGVDAVILALGIAAGPGMVLRPVTLFSRATRLLLPAMREAGVPRLICVTGFGAGDSRDRGGCLHRLAFAVFLKRAYDDKDIQEQLIRDSDREWVIARPGILTDGRRTGRYRVMVEPETWRLGTISRADVADFLVRQIDQDRYIGTTPALAG
ncbi:NAD(P)-dependent oxidoreductase [Roseospira goensis]|uniref:Uncharacterized protein YbjT (DUF2867 family) n=1 Tax=Roseospira goensis TaxID=391922 RepID=A0A7W6RWG4_9PROT|nr:SDR family oxidoreductase [Roseospira goensis]MBB4284513.1 uncharacterized protein YbjT (DUF2867 family) [Roseospira goensis]